MELTLSEIEPIVKFIIDNNKVLETQGKKPVAINIVGEAGVGKSQSMARIARELDLNYVKLSLASISEMGDIVGFPIKLHYVCREDNCQWIAAELVDAYVKAGYTVTDETKMSYALPEWYKSINPEKGTMLLLDDYSRCPAHILQGIMELIYQQETWSFVMPAGTTIVLTSNPENAGDYNVSELDPAQKSRMVNFYVKFDIDSWHEWATASNVDNRAINFLLSYHHEFMTPNKETHDQIMNARTYELFSNIISGIKNWENPDNLALIHQIASGCFNDPENAVGNCFTTFIAKKLDKLIEPKDILLQDWKALEPRLRSCIYGSGKEPKLDISNLLAMRLLTYTMYYFDQKGNATDPVVTRLTELINANDKEQLIADDQLFHIVEMLVKKYPTRTNKFLLNPKIRTKLIKA